MKIGPTTSWDAWVGQAASSLRLVAHPGGEPVRNWIDEPGDALTLAFGPEGGLTTTEVDAARAAGWQTMDLGRRILRIETAAVAAASTLTLGRGDMPHRSA